MTESKDLIEKAPLEKKIDMIGFYGNPDANGDGLPDISWESANIVRIKPPYAMRWSWGGNVNAIAIHSKCAKQLSAALAEIGAAFSLAERSKYQLDQCAGGYHFRPKRGYATRLSTHAYGAAVDIAPLLNPLFRKYDAAKNMMPARSVEIFESHGFTWGGRWQRPDGMHFQYARPL